MIRATAEQPAYAAHYIQVGNICAYMQRIGYTERGDLVIEPFEQECAHTIFVSGTIYLHNDTFPLSREIADLVDTAQIQTLLDTQTIWQINIP